MIDSPGTRTRLFSPGRSNNNNNHLSHIFTTRRSMTFTFAFTITIFFIISTIFFVFSHVSYTRSPVFVKYIMQNKSQFSTIFSHFFPNGTNPKFPQFSRKANGFSRKINGSSFSDPPRTSVNNAQFSGENNGVLMRNNGSFSDSGKGQVLSGVDALNSMVDSSGEELEKLINCDLFDGNWVVDDQLPMYQPGSCPFIDEAFDCFLNGRPDNGYERYRWQPKHCNIPRWNGKNMLELARGKRIVYVGDSLNRNMWESMVCMLQNDVENKSNVYEASGRVEFRTSGSYSFLFTNYNFSVEFFRTTFLVQEWEMPDGNGSTKETLRIDLVEKSSYRYEKADVLVFNSGHWWTHEKTTAGKGYYQEGSHVYDELDAFEAYRRALTTWGRWVEANVNLTKTLVFFRGYSPSHFSGGQWNSGGQCDNETEPIKYEKYININDYVPYLEMLEKVLKGMKAPVFYLNVTRMSDFRKDAHPSIYRKQNLTEEERRSPERYQDCTHWCLPGVPDTWNEIIYAQMLKKYYLEQRQQRHHIAEGPKSR